MSPGDIVWSSVEDGFFVASIGGAFYGFVDRVDGEMFQVCDGQSQQIGLFGDLDSAMRCLDARAGSGTPAVHGEGR